MLHYLIISVLSQDTSPPNPFVFSSALDLARLFAGYGNSLSLCPAAGYQCTSLFFCHGLGVKISSQNEIVPRNSKFCRIHLIISSVFPPWSLFDLYPLKVLDSCLFRFKEWQLLTQKLRFTTNRPIWHTRALRCDIAWNCCLSKTGTNSSFLFASDSLGAHVKIWI